MFDNIVYRHEDTFLIEVSHKFIILNIDSFFSFNKPLLSALLHLCIMSAPIVINLGCLIDLFT